MELREKILQECLFGEIFALFMKKEEMRERTRHRPSRYSTLVFALVAILMAVIGAFLIIKLDMIINLL